jgi:hypothetical protein
MKNCTVCKIEFVQKSNTTGKYCSLNCFWKVPKLKAEKHHAWKGGRYDHDGYVRVYHNGGRILEHRLVMEQKIGRPMLPTETVHHRNGVRSDNRPENLELRVGQHGKGSTVHCPTCSCNNN